MFEAMAAVRLGVVVGHQLLVQAHPGSLPTTDPSQTSSSCPSGERQDGGLADRARRIDHEVRLGLMSDIHGNALALQAVLRDAADAEIDEWWVLGDIVAPGPNPVEVLDILNSLPTVKYVAGNTERYVLTGDRPYPSLTDVESDPALLPRLVEVAVTFTWTSGKITQAGWYAWLATLPSKIRTILPDGTRRHLRISDADLAVLLHQCDADVVFAGHPHDVTDRLVNGVRAVNLGSVSNSSRPDRAATYVQLDIDRDRHSIVHRVVDYDHGAVVSAIDEVAHPAGSYLKRFHQ